MRRPVWRSAFSVLVMFAVLSSVFRTSISFATSTEQQPVHFKHISHSKPLKHISTYITEVKEYAIENGEELDDESDDTHQLLGCFFRSQLTAVFTESPDLNGATKVIVFEDKIGRKNNLPLFIEFENFRL